MERTAIVELIRTLQPEECADFDLFLSGSWLNPDKPTEEIRRLFHCILEALNRAAPQALQKEQMYPALFPGKPEIKGKLEKLMAETHKQLRTFLQIRQYLEPKNAFQRQLDLAAYYQSRGLPDRYLQTLGRLNAEQDQEPWKNTEYFFRQFQLEFSLHEHQSVGNQKKGDLNIPSVLRNLDIYYHLHRLDLLNYFLLQSRATNLEISEEIRFALQENALPERYLQESGLLLISYRIFNLLQVEEPQPTDFQEIAHLIQQYETQLAPPKLEQCYAYLRNLCVILIHNGREDFWPSLHQLQRDNLQRGFLYHAEHEGKLTPSAVLNLVSVALHVGQVNWVGAFLESHRDRIIGDNETADFYRLNRACHRFALGQLDAALDDIPPSSPYLDYHLMARRLEIKIYYEQQSDLLPYKVDAFKMLISRMSKKYLSASLRERNANFINLVFQLQQTAPQDKKRAGKIMARLQSKQGMAERQWLEEKVKAIL